MARQEQFVDGRGDRFDLLARQLVLADHFGAVRQPRAELKILLGDGAHHAAHGGELGKRLEHRGHVPALAQVPAGQDQVADARAAKVEVARHRLGARTQQLAHDRARGFADRVDQRVGPIDQVAQPVAERLARRVVRQTEREHLVERRVAVVAFVGQCEQAIAQVADGDHGERPSHLRGAAAVVERREDVDRVPGVALELARDAAQRGAATEKQDARALRGLPPVALHARVLGLGHSPCIGQESSWTRGSPGLGFTERTFE